MLIEKGADVNVAGEDYKSALLWAAFKGKLGSSDKPEIISWQRATIQSCVRFTCIQDLRRLHKPWSKKVPP